MHSTLHSLASRAVSAALGVLLIACSNDTTSSHDQKGPGETGWVSLLTGAWSVQPGTESYTCVRQTVTEETWIRAFRPISPEGSHHSFLFIDDPASDGGAAKPDGTTECEQGGFTVGTSGIFGSGVGTRPFALPEGVATKIPAGTQLLLNLHLFNVSDTTITGTSGVEMIPVDRSSVVHEVEAVAAGKTASLSVPPGRSTQTGTCTLPSDVTILSVGPHMHMLGRHMTTKTMPASGAGVTLLDRDYSFDDQNGTLLDTPIVLLEGDKLQIACTYENPHAKNVAFGQSSQDEMCFTGMYWYPPRPAGVLGPFGPAGAFCADD